MASKSSKKKDDITQDDKARLRDITRKLYVYFQTPEGERVGKEITKALLELRKLGEPKAPVLTVAEEKAFKFIKEQILLKKHPTVRDISWAAGLKSSRSGVEVVKRLIQKGVLVREGAGKLAVKN